MKKFLQDSELLSALNSRYAVKKFEKREMDTRELEEIVTSILQLTPTSFGLQAYKFLIIEDNATREALKEFSWGQSQVTDADMFLVFCVPTDFNKSYIEKHVHSMQNTRGFDDAKAEGIIDFMNEKIIETGEELWIVNPEEWLTRQLYISLGNLMTSLAVLGIDSCPMEGLNPQEYDRILKLNERNLTAKVALPIGKRHSEDAYQHEKKARFPKEELVIRY